MEGSQLKGTVILFRSPKDDEEDPYEKTLTSAGFTAFSMPVLDFNFVNIDVLHGCLLRSSGYSGIILTSPRAVEACSYALEKLDDEMNKSCKDIACYCVGPATKQHANQIGFKSVDCEAGNADKLSKYITENTTAENSKPLLYPCGNLRRDTLSAKLKSAGFPLEEVVVYETVKSKTIQTDITNFIKLHGAPRYIVYFSPSGVQYTADLFESGILKLRETKIIAIGNTTEAELKGRQMEVAAVARTPDHTGLTEALLKASEDFKQSAQHKDE